MRQSTQSPKSFTLKGSAAIVLALVLSFGLLPTSAFAGEAKFDAVAEGRAQISAALPALSHLDVNASVVSADALATAEEAPAIETDQIVNAITSQAVESDGTPGGTFNCVAQPGKGNKTIVPIKMAGMPGKLTVSGTTSKSIGEVALFCEYNGQTPYVARFLNSGTGFGGTWYLPQGMYYLLLDNTGGTTPITVTGSFTIKVYKDSANEPFSGNNNTIDRASSIKFKKVYYGVIGTYSTQNETDYIDFYKFKVSYATEISILSKSTDAMKGESFSVYKADGSYYAGGQVNKTLTISIKDNGTYYLKFGSSYPASGAYQFKMTYGPDSKVSVNNAKSRYDGTVKLQWGKVAGAKKYQVYRSEDYGKTWQKVATTTKKSFKQTGLDAYKTYLYKVRGVAGSAKGNFSITWQVSWDYL